MLRKLQVESNQLIQHQFASDDQDSPLHVRSWYSCIFFRIIFFFIQQNVEMSFGSGPNFLDHQALRTTKIRSRPMLISCDNIGKNMETFSRIPCSNNLLGNWGHAEPKEKSGKMGMAWAVYKIARLQITHCAGGPWGHWCIVFQNQVASLHPHSLTETWFERQLL